MNLADSDRPGDVYTAILKLVMKDIEKETDERFTKYAKLLEG